ncbi:hypothetical protein Fmac_009566 [Flemingia macrophylla]|uniref:Uncharacterized protein n=1 Tax=Flemingia macrophylla TaxID=520843 RepID=A0ABD1N173_9FABA
MSISWIAAEQLRDLVGSARVDRVKEAWGMACHDSNLSATTSIGSTLDGDSEPITALTLSPNDTLLFSSSHTRQIRVWDLSTLKVMKVWLCAWCVTLLAGCLLPVELIGRKVQNSLQESPPEAQSEMRPEWPENDEGRLVGVLQMSPEGLARKIDVRSKGKRRWRGDKRRFFTSNP